MSKILITGGAGFIGSQLGKSLVEEGHDVILVDNMSYGYLDNLFIDGRTFGRFVGLEVRAPEFRRHCEGVDCILHFAGISALPVCQERPQLLGWRTEVSLEEGLARTAQYAAKLKARA